MIIIHRNGQLANQMFQLMLAVEIETRLTGDIDITGYDIPDWNLSAPHAPPFPERPAYLYFHRYNLDQIAYLFNVGAISTIIIAGWGMRLEYYPDPTPYRDLFTDTLCQGHPSHERDILLNVRTGDITSGFHPEYYPLPYAYYERIIDETSLTPVFMGQLTPNSYTDGLRRHFSGATFLETRTPMHDFSLIRNAKHVALSISSFAWLAAWLSQTLETIHMPIRGLFDPRHPQINLIPLTDIRYRFYDVFFPAKQERRTLFNGPWAQNARFCRRIDTMTIQKIMAEQVNSNSCIVSSKPMSFVDQTGNHDLQFFWNNVAGTAIPDTNPNVL